MGVSSKNRFSTLQRIKMLNRFDFGVALGWVRPAVLFPSDACIKMRNNVIVLPVSHIKAIFLIVFFSETLSFLDSVLLQWFVGDKKGNSVF